MKIVDPILASDLDAYVDDQLDVSRRIEVEAYLSEHPESAAQVMADLRFAVSSGWRSPMARQPAAMRHARPPGVCRRGFRPDVMSQLSSGLRRLPRW